LYFGLDQSRTTPCFGCSIFQWHDVAEEDRGNGDN